MFATVVMLPDTLARVAMLVTWSPVPSGSCPQRRLSYLSVRFRSPYLPLRSHRSWMSTVLILVWFEGCRDGSAMPHRCRLCRTSFELLLKNRSPVAVVGSVVPVAVLRLRNEASRGRS